MKKSTNSGPQPSAPKTLPSRHSERGQGDEGFSTNSGPQPSAPKTLLSRHSERGQGDEVVLRSEEVEAVLGQTPPWVFRWGITVMALLVAALLAGTWFIHWPETMTVQGTVSLPATGGRWADMVVHLPAQQVRSLRKGMKVQVALDIKDEAWGRYDGTVSDTPLQKDNSGLYPLHIRIDARAATDTGHASLGRIATFHRRQYAGPSALTMDATATITLTDKRLLQHIVRN